MVWMAMMDGDDPLICGNIDCIGSIAGSDTVINETSAALPQTGAFFMARDVFPCARQGLADADTDRSL